MRRFYLLTMVWGFILALVAYQMGAMQSYSAGEDAGYIQGYEVGHAIGAMEGQEAGHLEGYREALSHVEDEIEFQFHDVVAAFDVHVYPKALEDSYVDVYLLTAQGLLYVKRLMVFEEQDDVTLKEL